MVAITTVGLDIAKSVFQVHGVDARGSVVVRRQLKRRYVLALFKKLPPCLVGIEAGSGAHHWARELTKLGHDVRLMPPQFVRPYVKTNKNDAADAEACCEAVQRPGMRFVPTKTIEQQAAMALHRVRDHLVCRRTATINALRGHLAEYGLVAQVQRTGLKQLFDIVSDDEDEWIDGLAVGDQLTRHPERDETAKRVAREGVGTRRLDEPTPSEIHQLAEHLKANVVTRRNGRGGRGAKMEVQAFDDRRSSRQDVQDDRLQLQGRPIGADPKRATISVREPLSIPEQDSWDLLPEGLPSPNSPISPDG